MGVVQGMTKQAEFA